MKYISIKQAAETLNVSYYRACQLVHDGKLKDHGTTEEGKKKHNPLLLLSEVKEFKKNTILPPNRYKWTEANSEQAENRFVRIPPAIIGATSNELPFVKKINDIHTMLKALCEAWGVKT